MEWTRFSKFGAHPGELKRPAGDVQPFNIVEVGQSPENKWTISRFLRTWVGYLETDLVPNLLSHYWSSRLPPSDHQGNRSWSRRRHMDRSTHAHPRSSPRPHLKSVLVPSWVRWPWLPRNGWATASEWKRSQNRCLSQTTAGTIPRRKTMKDWPTPSLSDGQRNTQMMLNKWDLGLLDAVPEAPALWLADVFAYLCKADLHGTPKMVKVTRNRLIMLDSSAITWDPRTSKNQSYKGRVLYWRVSWHVLTVPGCGRG